MEEKFHFQRFWPLFTKKMFVASILLLLTVSIHAESNYSQTTKVNINRENATLSEIFRDIERQSEFRFFYNNAAISKVQAKTVKAENQLVTEILDNLFLGTDLSYRIVDKYIVVADRKSDFAPLVKQAAQQQARRKITGTVTDVDGEPVPGANIIEKGAGNGTVSDDDGNFSLEVSAQNAVIKVSYIGFTTQEVAVGNSNTLNIKLEEDNVALEEVVVVGYGAQKKLNLTGSVSTVKAEKLESRATTNLSSSLSGLASGVTVRQSSGKPGSDEANISIRGTGTFNSSYTSPLVIVDGSEASISSVNPDDVESISFLKDAASAAIYGSRGANGVLLITTKKGKLGEKPHVTYSGVFSQTEMSGNKFRFESSFAEYMEMANRWYTNIKYDAATKYTQENIDEWRAAEAKDRNATDNEWGIPNWLAYPNTQWVDYLFTPSTTTKHNVSVSGGSENNSYLVSLNYLDNPGSLKNTAMNQFSARINMESKINKFLTIGTQTYGSKQQREPGSTSLTYIFQTLPNVTPYYDGKYGYAEDGSSTNNILAQVQYLGGQYDQTRLNTTGYVDVNIMKGLTAKVRYNYQTTFSEEATFDRKVDQVSFRTGEILNAGKGSTAAATTRATTRYQNHTTAATLNYLNSFGAHDIGGLLGYEQYYWNVKGFSATRTGLLDLDLPDFTAATDKKDPTLGGTPEQDYAVVSFFGRLNYGYKGKYLFEANFRRDGSSRFGPDHRWGIFPSFSAAWRLSEESFMQSLKNVVSNLKLRASWGQLGNTTSGYYEWQATYGAVNYSLDGNIYDGLRQGKIANPLLHWEAVTSSDIGLDAGFLNNRLTLELDYYDRLTKGILATPSVYLTMGTVSAPTTNTSDMQNRGIEATIGWNDRIKDFRYSVSANFSYNHNVISKYKGKYTEGWGTDKDGNRAWITNRGDVADYGSTTIRVEGHQFDEYYLWARHKGNGNIYLADGVTPDPNGGPKDGMIRTKADLDWVKAMVDYVDPATGKKPYNFNNQSVGQSGGLWYGECIYADRNGDGLYGTNDNDRYFTGKSSIPKYGFGLNMSAAWKGFDMNMTWAGNAGMWYYIYERGFNNMSSANWQEGTIVALNARQIYYWCDPKEAALNPDYDPAKDPNANINAPYMRISNVSAGHRNNDSELYEATYLKLKTLQIGYTLPKKLTEKAYVNNLRLFVSGENILTLTQFPGVDPEIGGSGFQAYPIPRILSCGINITF